MLFSYTLFTITPISTSLCCCKTLALNQLILFLLNPAGRSAKVPSFFPLLSSLLHPFVHKYKYRTVYFICKSVIVHVYYHIRVHVLSCRFWSSNWINYNVFLLVHLFCGMTHQNKETNKEQRSFTRDKSGQLCTKTTKAFKTPRTIISNRSTYIY